LCFLPNRLTQQLLQQDGRGHARDPSLETGSDQQKRPLPGSMQRGKPSFSQSGE